LQFVLLASKLCNDIPFAQRRLKKGYRWNETDTGRVMTKGWNYARMGVHINMIFPLDLFEIGFLLAITALIIIAASELILSSPRYKTRLLISRKKLKNMGILFSILFLTIVILRIISLILYF
jgi:hypothetical protein